MLLRPQPLPDELAAGYKGRVLRLNGWSDTKEGMRWLQTWAGSGGTNRREVSAVEVLAKVAGVAAETFVFAHTTLPLRRSVISSQPQLPHGSTEQVSILWTLALRDIRPGAYFCARCVEEDLGFHGMPYWRREHQLPGVYCCSKHGHALSCVDTANAFLSSPTDFTEAHQVVSESWAAELKRSEAVKRFIEICSDLLSRRFPLDERLVSRAARERAMCIGLHVGRGKVKMPLLSDSIKSQFDEAWLAGIAPGLIEKLPGEYWQPVDGAVAGKRAGLNALVYALAFAVLFESADDAINAMASTNLRDQPTSKPHRDASQIDDALLRSAFAVAHGSHRTVAAKVGLSQWTVTNRLTALGLPPLGKLNPKLLRTAIEELLHQDAPLSDVCAKYGLDLNDVRAALSDALFPLASSLEQIVVARPKKTGPRPKPALPPRQKTSIAGVLATCTPSIKSMGISLSIAEMA
jgi:hypothetical protein